ncbi:hypothetical protein FOL47_004119 [Perkinsus chesapeaki]|uniref:40S ribosomal protein S30 n=1 Tax=Perkinsus chesapeaki TaxID=330153 RepID=A0A7J6M4B1_PERCH|nr:hypothetical protein FOL47_004119 [Perkinsus chesapeaki]
MGKVHGSLARAGKVKNQTPKVPKQEKKKAITGRARKRMQYNRRFSAKVTGGPKRGPNSNQNSPKGSAGGGELDGEFDMDCDGVDMRYRNPFRSSDPSRAWNRMESVDSCHGEVVITDDSSPNRVAQNAEEYFAGRGKGKRRSRSGSGVMLSTCPSEVLDEMSSPGIEPAPPSNSSPATPAPTVLDPQSVVTSEPPSLSKGSQWIAMTPPAVSSAPRVMFKPFVMGDASTESSPAQPDMLDYSGRLEAAMAGQQAGMGRRGGLVRGRSILERFTLIEESEEDGCDEEDEVNVHPDSVQPGGVGQSGGSQPSGIDALARLQMSMMNQQRKKKEKGRVYSHRSILERLNLLEESDGDDDDSEERSLEALSTSSPSPDMSTSSAEESSSLEEDHRETVDKVGIQGLDTPKADKGGNRKKRRRADRDSLSRVPRLLRRPLDSQETAHEIFPRLFLGGHMVARNRELLRKYNITSVVCCCTITEYPEDVFFTSDGIDYYRVDVEDMSCEPIDWFWDEAHDHMDKTLRPYLMSDDSSPASASTPPRHSLGGVLVHCRSGVSRSASTLISYLVKRRGLSLYHALTHKLQELEMGLREDKKSTVDRKMYFSWYNNCRDVDRDEGQKEEMSSEDTIDNIYSRQIDWEAEPPMVDIRQSFCNIQSVYLEIRKEEVLGMISNRIAPLCRRALAAVNSSSSTVARGLAGRAFFSSEGGSKPSEVDIAARTVEAIKEYLQMRREEVAVEHEAEKGGAAARTVAEEALKRLDENIVTFGTKTADELLSLSFESLGFDGLEEVECLLQIEEAFDVKLPDEAFNKLKCGQEAMEAVKQQLKEQAKEEMSSSSTHIRPSSAASPSLRLSGLGEVTQLTTMSQVRTSPKWSFTGRTSSLSARGNMVPGPGQYRVSRLGDIGGGPSFRFGTGSRDGGDRGRSRYGSPGPGAYNPRPASSTATIGFGSGRPDGAMRRSSTPGPGHYAPGGSMGKSGRMYSMASRPTRGGVPSDAAWMPGPGQYRVTGPSPVYGRGPQWSFGSSCRAKEGRKDDSGPGPGAYAEHGRIGENARKCGFGRPRPQSASLHGRTASEAQDALKGLTTLESACIEAPGQGGHWLCRTRFTHKELESALSVFLRLLLVEIDTSSELEKPFRRVKGLVDRHLAVSLCPDCVDAFVTASRQMTRFLQANFEQDTVEEAMKAVYYPYHDTRLHASFRGPPVARAIGLMQWWGGLPTTVGTEEFEGQSSPSEFLDCLHFASWMVHDKLMEKEENDDWVVETVCASLRRIRVTNSEVWIAADSPWTRWAGPLEERLEVSSRARKIRAALLEASAAACCCCSSSEGWWFPRGLWDRMAGRGEPCVISIAGAVATSGFNTSSLEEGVAKAVETLKDEDLPVLKDTCFSLAAVPSLTSVVNTRLGGAHGEKEGLREMFAGDSRAVEGLSLWCQQQTLAVGVENVTEHAWEVMAKCALPAALQFMASIPVLKVFLRSVGSLAVEVLERRGGAANSSSTEVLPGPLQFVVALVDTLTSCPKASLSYNLFDVSTLHTALADWVFENVPADWSGHRTTTSKPETVCYTAMTDALATLEKRMHGDEWRRLPSTTPAGGKKPPGAASPSDEEIASNSLPSLPSSPDDWDNYTPSRPTVGVLSVSSSSDDNDDKTEELQEQQEEDKPREVPKDIKRGSQALKAIAGALDRGTTAAAAPPTYRAFANKRAEVAGGKPVQSKIDSFLKPSGGGGTVPASSWHSTSHSSRVERAFAHVWDKLGTTKSTAMSDGAKRKVAPGPPPPPLPSKPRPVARLAASPKRATSGIAIPTGSAAMAKADAHGKPPPMFESKTKPRKMKMERTKIRLTQGSGMARHERDAKKGNIEVEREHAVDDLHRVLLCRDPFSTDSKESDILPLEPHQRNNGNCESFSSADEYVKWFRPALLFEAAEGLRRSLSTTEGSSVYWGIPSLKISRSSRKGKWATLTVKSQIDESSGRETIAGARPQQKSGRRVEALSQGDLVLLVRSEVADSPSLVYDQLLNGVPLTHLSPTVRQGTSIAFGLVFKDDADRRGNEDEGGGRGGKFRSARIKIPFESDEAVVLGSATTPERECEGLDWILTNSTFSPLRDLLISPSVPVLRPSVGQEVAVGDLNAAQARAVRSAADISSPITLVQGPPGTGKTKTIVGMVKALLEKSIKLVICAPSNAAVDELASRILHSSLPPDKDPPGTYSVVRVGSYRRITRDEVRAVSVEELAKAGGRDKAVELKDSHREKRAAILMEIRKLDENIRELSGDNDAEVREDRGRLIARKKELKEQLDKLKERSSRALSRSRDEALKHLLGQAKVVLGTLSSFGSSAIVSNFMAREATCIIDEACQAIEPSALIPLKLRGVKRLIMVGDPQQLPATVMSAEAKALRYERSLFERLVSAGWQAHLLDEQYRMLPEIADFASKEFYEGRLRTAPTCRFPSSFGVPLRPLLFLDARFGGEERARGGTSLVNIQEAGIVNKLIDSMRSRKKMSIGVVTPYRQQAMLIRNMVSNGADLVDTVDAYQGQEKDIIIMSCVRSSRDGGIGFVADYRRLNVSLTRAKYALWIVGNAESLGRSSKVWADLIQHCKDVGALVDARRLDKRTRYTASEERPLAEILELCNTTNTVQSPQLMTDNKRMRY